MRLRSLRFVLAAAVGVIAFTLGAHATAPPLDDAPQYGPANGSLVIIGGNMQESSGLAQKFIQLAGGPDKNFVIIPTNNGNRNPDGSLRVYNETTVLAPWIKRGLTHVAMLHTADPKVANTEEFVKPLLTANGVWFDGGRQWNGVDSYAGTRALEEFRKVLDRGGVIAGSSAGATIQGDYLVRGDTKGPDIMMTEEAAHQHGFAFLRHVAIDQHINARNRWDDLIPVIKKYPDLLGIGLSEDTGIIVHGDQFEVMGKWKVAVHDNTRAYEPWEKPYFVLSQGDVYDMKARRVVKYGNGVTGRGGGGGGGGGGGDLP
ncbi:MAG TPA: cyanophycinase [Vicinamibacterales bacterium]|nr:cyanophycinase [Vicinamibacterales bacterium]